MEIWWYNNITVRRDETSGTVRLLAQHGRLVREVEFDTIKTCILSFLIENKVERKKFKEIWKKHLTREKKSDIINKLSAKRIANISKRFWKNLKKELDKMNEMWYNRKAGLLKKTGDHIKKFLKKLEKVLDKNEKMWYNKKASAEKRERKKNSILKIEQCKKVTTLEIPFMRNNSSKE